MKKQNFIYLIFIIYFANNLHSNLYSNSNYITFIEKLFFQQNYSDIQPSSHDNTSLIEEKNNDNPSNTITTTPSYNNVILDNSNSTKTSEYNNTDTTSSDINNHTPDNSVEPFSNNEDTAFCDFANTEDTNQIIFLDSSTYTMLSLVNKYRTDNNLNQLEMDNSLLQVAKTRVLETHLLLSHNRPDGRSFSSALKDLGLVYSICGENICAGFSNPENALNSLIESSTHKDNILNPNFNKIGVSCIQTNDGYGYYWVQIFSD